MVVFCQGRNCPWQSLQGDKGVKSPYFVQIKLLTRNSRYVGFIDH